MRGTSAINVIAALGIAISAPAALAVAAGQTGATGRPNGGTCNRCHGTQLYDGLDVEVVQGERKECYAQLGVAADDLGPFVLANTFYLLDLSQPGAPVRTTLRVTAPEPPTATPKEETCTFGFQANCTATPELGQSCCSTEGDTCSGGICVPEKSLFCPADSTCGPPVAGFDLEIAGPGHLEAGADSQGDAPLPTGAGTFGEVYHTAPKGFTGGAVSWDLVYQAPNVSPSGGNNPQSATIYASVNACNNNGVQDQGDITTITDVDIFFKDPVSGIANAPACRELPICTDAETGELIPGSEGVNFNNLSCCPDGIVHDIGNNKCVVGGCTCVVGTTAQASYGAAALLILGGFLATRRRRS